MESFKLQNENGGIKNLMGEAKKRPILTLILGLVILGIFVNILSGGSSGNSASVTQSAPVANDQPLLEVISFDCTYTDYFYTVSGEVKNITGESLKNVEAVGSTYTADGTFVNSEDALIEYNPILPGQTSPFKVIMSLNPEMKNCKLGFKDLMGGKISARAAAGAAK